MKPGSEMSLRKSLPSPTALFMFEAAAKNLSFTKAGTEFNVTQSAVSRMIKRLEVHLGTELFNRNPTGLELTSDGAELFKAVSSGFRTIEAGLEDLRSRQGNARRVTISLSSAFAMHWFVPRVDRFQERFPDIDLRFQLVKGEPLGPFDDVDLAIRYNHPPNTEQHSWKLAEEVIVPVCSVLYREQHGSLDDFARGHVCAKQSGQMRIPWPVFLDKTNAIDLNIDRYLTFSDYALVVQAALKGRALALGWLHVVGSELLEEGLVRAGPQCLKTGYDYNVVATKARPLRDVSSQVKDWIVGEMTDMMEQVSAR
ncbi:LysR substrate-binding domain-containing protein [Shinella curvata]|uniref:LysR substrate-binding domain-containing protein n=1 Tax=Shinella curvata TaxID=1817964 RepID=A0ABT8XB40_9HYPH|nr:LysR substrate-binding domain-containing protein [Shinella curvata]MCJ8054650.1 LysR substrate-binding domain-containing protein [Shinella curvata]MDO6120955.1 LysR substrate-binding domain-containing protein [Shinella curvata]